MKYKVEMIIETFNPMPKDPDRLKLEMRKLISAGVGVSRKEHMKVTPLENDDTSYSFGVPLGDAT